MAQNKKPSMPRTRSPNYPAIDLETAISKAETLFKIANRHAVGAEVIAKAWDLSPKSSNFQLALAAERAYGLVVAAEGNRSHLLTLTTLALDIVSGDYQKGSAEQLRAIKKASLNPKTHTELWARWGPDLPPDDEMRRYLVRERKFNDKAVGDFIAEYKKTLAYANLTAEDKILAADDQTNSVAVGDVVQWNSQGVDQFATPRRVISLSPDGQWAFVEGSDTGVPMAQLTKADTDKAGLPPQPPLPMIVPLTPLAPLVPGSRMRDLPITLPTNLDVATLRLPVPMSEADFKTLVGSLEAMRGTLVEKKK